MYEVLKRTIQPRYLDCFSLNHNLWCQRSQQFLTINTKSPLLTPVTNFSSIGITSWTTTTSKVIVISLSGRWKVYVSVIHLSTNVVIRWWFISMLFKINMCMNSTCSITFMTRWSSHSKCLKIQMECRLGRISLSFPSHKSFLTCLCCWDWWLEQEEGWVVSKIFSQIYD